jgi:hypothetical protein
MIAPRPLLCWIYFYDCFFVSVLYFFDQLFVTRHAWFFLTPDLSVSDQTRFIARGWPRVNPGLMKSWSKKYSTRMFDSPKHAMRRFHPELQSRAQETQLWVMMHDVSRSSVV